MPRGMKGGINGIPKGAPMSPRGCMGCMGLVPNCGSPPFPRDAFPFAACPVHASSPSCWLPLRAAPAPPSEPSTCCPSSCPFSSPLHCEELRVSENNKGNCVKVGVGEVRYKWQKTSQVHVHNASSDSAIHFLSNQHTGSKRQSGKC